MFVGGWTNFCDEESSSWPSDVTERIKVRIKAKIQEDFKLYTIMLLSFKNK